MKNLILKALLAIFLLNAATYWVFVDNATQDVVIDKYLQFTERRINNDWNIDTTEYVYVASCGDEFFRDKETIDNMLSQSNPKGKAAPTDSRFARENNFSQHGFRTDDDFDPMDRINSRTDILGSKKLYRIQSVYTKALSLLLQKHRVSVLLLRFSNKLS
jgi:hypothetical protein